MKDNKTIKVLLIWLALAINSGTTSILKADTYPNFSYAFQWAVFYNGLLEFSDAATLTFNGRVLCNSNIYVGSPSSLTFNQVVTASGIITNPSWVGISQSSYTGAVIYNGTPAPGFVTNYPTVTFASGIANTPAACREIINLPPNGENTNLPISAQRYFNKAFLVITVTNTGINVAIKNSLYDVAPLTFSNNAPTNTVAWTNWNQAHFTNWLSTNTTFLDDREGRTNHVTQIDISKFGIWINTNTNCLPKWNHTNPFNGIIYIADFRTTNANWMNCVRLLNGKTIPTGGGSNSPAPYTIPGFTVATINPLYIQGLYNCPNAANVSSTNTSGCSPCSVVCDALTILSPAWTDSGSFSSTTAAADDTVNAAIIAGNVPSTGTSLTQFSGGVQNLPRLLENWTGDNLWLNTSLVCLYDSVQATKQFEQPGVYYQAPTRIFSYDQNLGTIGGIPPGTPIINKATATITFSNLSQPYDGTAKNISVITTPPGLSVNVSYSGSASAPTNQGSYLAVAVINDPVYQGIATNTLTITAPAPTPITLGSLTTQTDGSFQLVFTNTPGVHFTVLETTNSALPLTNWIVLGSVAEISPGQFQFSDTTATNDAQRFYVIRSP